MGTQTQAPHGVDLQSYPSSTEADMVRLEYKERITQDPQTSSTHKFCQGCHRDFKFGTVRKKDMGNLQVWSTSLQWTPDYLIL